MSAIEPSHYQAIRTVNRDAAAQQMRPRLLVAAVLLSAAVAGCSPGPMIDRLPTELGGLPSNAPQRPASQLQYPGINDAPGRPNPVLTPAEQLKLERDLSSARAQQQRLQDPAAVERARAQADKSTAARQQAIEAARKKATTADKR